MSKKPYNYAALGRLGDSITVAGEADLSFTQDSEQPVVSDEEKEVVNTGEIILLILRESSLIVLIVVFIYNFTGLLL